VAPAQKVFTNEPIEYYWIETGNGDSLPQSRLATHASPRALLGGP
jgi:hypothetical protein